MVPEQNYPNEVYSLNTPKYKTKTILQTKNRISANYVDRKTSPFQQNSFFLLQCTSSRYEFISRSVGKSLRKEPRSNLLILVCLDFVLLCCFFHTRFPLFLFIFRPLLNLFFFFFPYHAPLMSHEVCIVIMRVHYLCPD